MSIRVESAEGLDDPTPLDDSFLDLSSDSESDLGHGLGSSTGLTRELQ